jgi:hypothetical protein
MALVTALAMVCSSGHRCVQCICMVLACDEFLLRGLGAAFVFCAGMRGVTHFLKQPSIGRCIMSCKYVHNMLVLYINILCSSRMKFITLLVRNHQFSLWLHLPFIIVSR